MPADIAAVVDRVPICGCGSGTAWDIVLEILERSAAFSNKYEKDERGIPHLASEGDRTGPSLYDHAEDAAGRWVEFAAHVLGEHPSNLLEHGTGIGYAWPTDDGWKLLAFLREHGTNDSKWPEREDE